MSTVRELTKTVGFHLKQAYMAQRMMDQVCPYAAMNLGFTHATPRNMAIRTLIYELEKKLEPEPWDEWAEKTKRPASPSRTIKKLVFERDGYRCVICGTWKDLTIDHIVPKSKGGTNDPGNLQTMCRICNSKKGTGRASQMNG